MDKLDIIKQEIDKINKEISYNDSNIEELHCEIGTLENDNYILEEKKEELKEQIKQLDEEDEIVSQSTVSGFLSALWRRIQKNSELTDIDNARYQ